MTAPDAIGALLAVIGAFGLGFVLGRRQAHALRHEVATLRQLADDLDDEVSCLRLNALLPPRRQP